jgi:YD repeat-containing protein
MRSELRGYDAMDRLTSATTPSRTQSFTYDGDGNRLTQGGDAANTYDVASGSNQLSSITGALARTYSYDGAGNTLTDGSHTFTYNDAGRMASVTGSSGTVSYLYNALGQRIRKATASTTTLFVYNEAGHLVGEYDGTGAVIQEIVWLGDTPVASVRTEPCGLSVFYIHTDHLNTPRVITRRSTADVVWRWDSDPFGTDGANENPSGLGAFSFNLRFPGQCFDGETGLHYNGFRDFDPAV